MYLMSLACVLTLHTHKSLARRSLRTTYRHHMHISTQLIEGKYSLARRQGKGSPARMRQPGNMVRLLAYASQTRMEVAWEPQHVLCQVTRWPWRERNVQSFVITSSALPVRRGLSTPASLIVAVSAVDSIPIAEVTSLYQITTSRLLWQHQLLIDWTYGAVSLQIWRGMSLSGAE